VAGKQLQRSNGSLMKRRSAGCSCILARGEGLGAEAASDRRRCGERDCVGWATDQRTKFICEARESQKNKNKNRNSEVLGIIFWEDDRS
jgi:hypothetical protein